jgi:hypothetical protein
MHSVRKIYAWNLNIFLFSGTVTVGIGREVIFHTTIRYKEKCKQQSNRYEINAW